MIKAARGVNTVGRKRKKETGPYDGLRFWSALTHGTGAVMGAIGGAALLILAARHGRASVTLVSLAIFAVSMVALYLASCLYHCMNTNVKGRLRLRKLDHAMIYILIAGTYTPICLSVLGGVYGIGLFIAIWTMAAIGVVVTMAFPNAPRVLTTGFYVAMGWTVVLALRPLTAVISPAALAWMVAGGVLYTVGSIIYALKWPLKDNARFGSHELFHVFVLLGSACFFIVMCVEFL